MQLAELAASQGDVLHRSQILAAGRTDSWIVAQLEARRWQPASLGTYALFTGPLPWQSQAWAALLYAGPGAVLGGESALRGAGMRREGPALPIRVCVPHDRRVREQEGIQIRRRRHLARLAHANASLPRLRFEVAVLETASEQRGVGPAIGVIADACQQRLTSPVRLLSFLPLKPRLRWRHVLIEVIADVATGAYSYLEVTYLRDVERPHGLPTGARQRVVRRGPQRWYRDVEYVGFGVISELDGRLGHESAGDRAADMDRDNAASAGRSVTFRFGYRQVTETPCETAGTIARALLAKGWSGSPRRCSPNCRLWG